MKIRGIVGLVAVLGLAVNVWASEPALKVGDKMPKPPGIHLVSKFFNSKFFPKEIYLAAYQGGMEAYRTCGKELETIPFAVYLIEKNIVYFDRNRDTFIDGSHAPTAVSMRTDMLKSPCPSSNLRK